VEGICHFWVVPADTAVTSFWNHQYLIPSGSTPRAVVSPVTSPAYSLAGFRQQSRFCFARLRRRMSNSKSGSVERPESSSGKRSGHRLASTDVLFSAGQLWYLHAIVRCLGRIQNSGCVDPVRSSHLRDFIDPLQRSVHTRSCPFGVGL
jgi:hypothetical protein